MPQASKPDVPEPKSRWSKAGAGIAIFIVGLPMLAWATMQVHREFFETPEQRAAEDRAEAQQAKSQDKIQAAQDAADARESWISFSEAFAQRRMQAALKDPGSARFGRLWVEDQKAIDPKIPGVVCGEVNARDAAGAYTGMKNFIVVGGVATQDDGKSTFGPLWARHCTTKPA